ncbi:GNAT family N-acetyltransferase [Pararhizobium sp.]|uniref:GNAT family N-acetyltransferase n=1 Tax=Pararhizobium sp. TaxID=1977563 RepID=UPI002716A2B3|nr:GNAT family N-acetyltransferase [Pararhizobium sp.]MDO9417271.1 GNAT family N-acetyltransferase [Pararhizobium sp.]
MTETADILTLHRPPLVTIRTAKLRDLTELTAMIGELAAHHGDIAATSVVELERDLFSAVPWIAALVAEAEGRLIGYAILTPLYRPSESARGMEINHLYVRQAHRGTGIGRHLIDSSRDHARKAGCSYLSVSAATGNVQAHRFYEELSFKPRPVTGMRYLQAIA